MTTVFYLFSDAEHYNGVNLPDSVWTDAVVKSLLEGRAVSWGEVDAIPYQDQGRAGQPIGDFVGFLPHLPVVSARAADFLQRVQPGGAEYYPVRILGRSYFLWSVQAMSGALDMSKAVLKILPSGRVASVSVYSFLESELVYPFFKIKQVGLTSPVYVRGDLQQALIDEGFTGFGGAKKVWSSHA